MANLETDRGRNDPKIEQQPHLGKVFNPSGNSPDDPIIPAPVVKKDKDGREIVEIDPRVGGQAGNISLQPTYTSTQPLGFEGAPATMIGWDADSYIYDPAAGATLLPFGRAVSVAGPAIGTTERQVKLGGATGFRGISIRDITQNPKVGGDGYAAGWLVGVAWRGDIFIKAKSAVTVASAVMYDPATGEFGSHASCTVAVANAQYKRGAADQQIAILRLFGPQA